MNDIYSFVFAVCVDYSLNVWINVCCEDKDRRHGKGKRNSHKTKCRGSKVFTNGRVEQEITESIKNVVKTCQVQLEIFWKWEMVRIRKMFIVKSYFMPMVLMQGVEM